MFNSKAPFTAVFLSLINTLLPLIFDPQGEVRDIPRFCLFYISFALELIALILSAVADVPLEAKEVVKKV